MDDTLKTIYTDKGYKISIRNSDFSYYQDDDFFGEGIEFRFNKSLEYATSKNLKNYSEEVFEIIFGIYDFDREYDGDGRQKEYKERAEELQKKYYIYPIDVYEHSTFAFRLGSVDKKYGISGVLLLDKKIWEGGTFCTDLKAIDHFLHNDYSDYFNGRVYDISVFKPHIRKDQEGNSMETRDFVDGICGFTRDYVDEGYIDNFESEYGILEKPFKS